MAIFVFCSTSQLEQDIFGSTVPRGTALYAFSCNVLSWRYRAPRHDGARKRATRDLTSNRETHHPGDGAVDIPNTCRENRAIVTRRGDMHYARIAHNRQCYEMIYKIPVSSVRRVVLVVLVVGTIREKLKFPGGHCLNDLLL